MAVNFVDGICTWQTEDSSDDETVAEGRQNCKEMLRTIVELNRQTVRRQLMASMTRLMSDHLFNTYCNVWVINRHQWVINHH